MADIDRNDARSNFVVSVVENTGSEGHPEPVAPSGAPTKVDLLAVSVLAPLREKYGASFDSISQDSETILWAQEMIELGLSQEEYAARIHQSVPTVKRKMNALGPGLRVSMRAAATINIETAVLRLLQVSPSGLTEKQMRAKFKAEATAAYASAKRYGVDFARMLEKMVSSGALSRHGLVFRAVAAHTVTTLSTPQARLEANAASARNAVEAALLQAEYVRAGDPRRVTIKVEARVRADEDLNALFATMISKIQEAFTEPETRLSEDPQAEAIEAAVTIALLPRRRTG